MYPYCRLSPQPPHLHSERRSGGRGVFPQPHEVRDPSRHALATASVTAALQMACANATSFEPKEVKKWFKKVSSHPYTIF